MTLYETARRRRPYAFRVLLIWFLAWVLVGVVLLATGSPPLFGPIEDFIFIALAAGLVFSDLSRRLTFTSAVKAFVWVTVVSSIIEYIGATTGNPFGAYTYTEAFGPTLLQTLPLSIPLAWFVVVLPPYLALELKLARTPAGTAILVVLTGFIVMLVDVGLEPVATVLRGYWLWEPGQFGNFFYGVPLRNFFGWWGTGTLIAVGLRAMLREPRLRPPAGRNFPALPFTVLLCVLLTFLAAAFGNGLWGASAILGLLILFFSLWMLAAAPRPLVLIYRQWKGLPAAPGLG
ncbi:MAG: carotenoid biosynthesis protein [Opitutales bacterium]